MFIKKKFLNKNISKKNTGLMSRVFTNGLEDQGSIPGQVISKTQGRKNKKIKK